jgi:hypothetical protein
MQLGQVWVLVIIFGFISTQSCVNLDPGVASIDRAIFALNSNSAAWQKTLMDLERDLNEHGKSLLAHEVTDLAQKGIATGGTEIKCSIDFVGQRMKQGLEKIKARITLASYEPNPPVVCQVVPNVFNLGHCESAITFYGYDFDTEALHAYVEGPTHQRREVTCRAAIWMGKQRQSG